MTNPSLSKNVLLSCFGGRRNGSGTSSPPVVGIGGGSSIPAVNADGSYDDFLHFVNSSSTDASDNDAEGAAPTDLEAGAVDAGTAAPVDDLGVAYTMPSSIQSVISNISSQSSTRNKKTVETVETVVSWNERQRQEEQSTQKLGEELTKVASSSKSIEWRSVSINAQEKSILSDAFGSAREGKVTAIMGHSGCGKTTLLNVLSGKVQELKNLRVMYDIKRNGKSFKPISTVYRSQIAYVAQTDALNLYATPRESIRFSARLRLPSDTEDSKIESIANRILNELKLEDIADTFIKHLSGGEARRTSLAVELVTNPTIVVLDEVTSGLDSSNALRVLQVLQGIAAGGATVICSIHQPNSQMFENIDSVVLMKQGRTVYNGSREDLPQYFANRNFEVPRSYNTPDWIMEVCDQFKTYDEMEMHGFRYDSCIQSRKGLAPHAFDDDVEKKTRHGLGAGRQICLLTKRGISNLRRDHTLIVLRYTIVVVGGVLAAIAFAGVGQEAFTNRVGPIFFTLLSTTVTVQVVLLEFIEECPVIVREMSDGYYSIFSYCVTRGIFDIFNTGTQTLIFLLIIYWSLELQGRFIIIYAVLFSYANICSAIGLALGGAMPDPRNAKELIPMVILPQILFCGFFVPLDSIPTWLASWVPYLMPLTYVFRLAINEEFKSCLDHETLEDKYKDYLCRTYLEHQAAGGDRNAFYWGMVVAWVVVFRIMSGVFLQRKVNK